MSSCKAFAAFFILVALSFPGLENKAIAGGTNRRLLAPAAPGIVPVMPMPTVPGMPLPTIPGMPLPTVPGMPMPTFPIPDFPTRFPTVPFPNFPGVNPGFNNPGTTSSGNIPTPPVTTKSP